MPRHLLIVLLLWMPLANVTNAQNKPASAPAKSRAADKRTKVIKVYKGEEVLLGDTSFVAAHDTTIRITPREARYVRVRKNRSAIATMFYDTLEQRAANGRVTKDIFGAVVKTRGSKERLVNSIIISENVFKPYDGLKVKSIVIKTIDVLEGSVIDTLERATTKVGIFVNKVHRDTRARIVERNLLIHVGESVDPYRFADNERVLRQFRPLRDARIYLQRDRKHKDEVHVIVAVQDVASLGFTGFRRSAHDYRFDAFHVNLGGTGTFLGLSYFHNAYYKPNDGWSATVANPNLFGTFIKGEVHYADNFIHKSGGAALSRDYFTPEIKYGGGLSYNKSDENFYIDGYDTLRLRYHETSFELWGGRSFQLRPRVNLIVNALVNPRNFESEHFVSSDSNVFMIDRTLVAGNIWLVKRNYLKSLRIRGFGRTEDIPVGAGIGLMYGKEFNDFSNRDYFQLEAIASKYFPRIGYINVLAAGGTFIREGKAENGLLTLNATAFSDLIRLRRTQMRNFLFFELMRGYNRVTERSLMITGKWRDANGNIPIGNRRLSIGAESDYFMPWYFYGFQFTLYGRFDLYLLSMDELIDRNSLFYSVKAGIRTLNENLVLPSFSIELGYFGKNAPLFPAAWQIRFITQLPDLFQAFATFKPEVRPFR